VAKWKGQKRYGSFQEVNGMYENENKTMNPEEELVDILLDFIIVAANLAKSINHAMKEKQIKEGGTVNGQNQRTGNGNQQPANRCSHY